MKNEIIYPIFLEVSQLCVDLFWMYLFEDLSYGICPFGTYIDENIIYCRFKGKQFNFSFKDKPIEKIHTDLISIFKNRLKIMSKIDYLELRSDFNHLLRGYKNKEWKDIKKKNIKDLLIEDYVLRMKKKHNLTIQQSQKLLSNILIGFNFKLITNNDIQYDSDLGYITDINGIDHTNCIDIPIIDTYDQYLDSKQIMKENWDKYINSI